MDTSGIELVISTRAKRRLGSFRPLPTPRITISALALRDEATFLDTIRHEYAHALVWLRSPGARHGHGAVWKAACREVGCRPRATVAPDAAQRDVQRQSARYCVRCTTCGQETLYFRAGKVVDLLRAGRGGSLHCPRCGGRAFTLTVNDRAAS